MWKRECWAKYYCLLMMSTLLLEANIAFCFLAIPCKTGLLPQSKVVLMNYLVAELSRVLFLKMLLVLFVCLTQATQEWFHCKQYCHDEIME